MNTMPSLYAHPSKVVIERPARDVNKMRLNSEELYRAREAALAAVLAMGMK